MKTATAADTAATTGGRVIIILDSAREVKGSKFQSFRN
jgi:hypothetical protein